MSNKGRISAIIGAIRLITEILMKTQNFSNQFLEKFTGMNFLHFAIFLFIISSIVLIVISLMNEVPSRKKIPGFIFATTNDLTSE